MSAVHDLIDSKGRRISRRDLFVAMGLNTLAASFGMAWTAMTYTMPLIMYMQAIGASGVIIGLVTTVRLVAVSAQIPSALASEHLHTRKPFWSRLALVHRFLWFAIAALVAWCPASWAWLPMAIIVVVAASEVLGNASTAPWLSWMADLIPLPIAGRFWGIRSSISTAASLLGLAAAGQILDAARDPVSGEAGARAFAIVFAIAAALGVTDIITHMFVREPRPLAAPLPGAPHHRILAPLANRDFRFITLSLGLWNLGLQMTVAFGLVYLKRDFGVTYSQLAAMTIAAALGAIITGYGFGQIMDRIGALRLGAILLFVTPLTLAPWFFLTHGVIGFGPFRFPQSIALLCGSGILSGAASSTVLVCQYRMAAEHFPHRGRTMAMAVHWSLVGLLGAIGPFLGGLIMDHFSTRISLKIFTGLPFSFYHAELILFTVLLWLVAAPLLLAVGDGGMIKSRSDA
jgi:MFS family permease